MALLDAACEATASLNFPFEMFENVCKDEKESNFRIFWLAAPSFAHYHNFLDDGKPYDCLSSITLGTGRWLHLLVEDVAIVSRPVESTKSGYRE